MRHTEYFGVTETQLGLPEYVILSRFHSIESEGSGEQCINAERLIGSANFKSSLINMCYKIGCLRLSESWR